MKKTYLFYNIRYSRQGNLLAFKINMVCRLACMQYIRRVRFPLNFRLRKQNHEETITGNRGFDKMKATNAYSNLEYLCRQLGHRFNNPELLMQALRHASYVNEQADVALEDNERLEFLGDAVLDLAVGHLLMERFKEAEEGVLSKFRAVIVDEAGLYQTALKLGLGEYLLLGKGEEQGRGREKPSILANTVEAIMGALYLDAGFDKALEVIRGLFSSSLDRVGQKETFHDFKSQLQEYTQKVYKILPKYQLIEESGPAHDKTFEVVLTLKGEILARGIGKTKKEAEQDAAKEAFFCLKEDSDR